MRAAASGRSCVARVGCPARADGYTIVELVTERGSLPPVLVHIAREPATGEPRVIGLRRL